MKKIPSLFVRDYEKVPVDYKSVTVAIDGAGHVSSYESDPIYKNGRFLATEQVTPGCEWVLNGGGIATRKWDGTAVLFMDGQWFKRYDGKAGRTPPPDFFEAQPEPDPITGHWPGWVPVVDDYKADKYIMQAIVNYGVVDDPEEGATYEAIGPMINGNKDNRPNHMLMKHGEETVFTKEWQERSFKTIRNQLEVLNIEGIVYHHSDGRMCKVKGSDFGLPW